MVQYSSSSPRIKQESEPISFLGGTITTIQLKSKLEIDLSSFFECMCLVGIHFTVIWMDRAQIIKNRPQISALDSCYLAIQTGSWFAFLELQWFGTVFSFYKKLLNKQKILASTCSANSESERFLGIFRTFCLCISWCCLSDSCT